MGRPLPATRPRPDSPPAAGSRLGTFTAVSALFAAVMTGTTLPTPLYTFWQRQYSFGAAMTTVIFATYAVGVLAALLTAGQASDQAGRRPVLAAALVLSVVSSAGFAAAGSLPVLFGARFVSGLAAGLTTAAATASLRELAGRRHPTAAAVAPGTVTMLGLGMGPLFAGVLAELVPAHSTTLPFVAHLALLVLAAPALIPADTVTARLSPTLVRRPRIVVPSQGRAVFWAAALAGFVCFALLGLFTSVVPTFLGRTLHEHSPALTGATVSAFFGAAVVAQVVLRHAGRRRAILAGLAGLLPALLLIVVALYAASYPLFLAGTVAAGAAAGTVFTRCLDTALSVAPAEQKAQVGSTYFTAAYIGLTIPVIGVGFGAQAFGDKPSVLAAAIVLAVGAAFSFAQLLRTEPEA
jgi:MFS family permease